MVDQQGACNLADAVTWTFQGKLVENLFEKAKEKHFVSDGQPGGSLWVALLIWNHLSWSR